MTSRLPIVLALCLTASTTAFSWPWSHTPKPPAPQHATPMIKPSDGSNALETVWRSRNGPNMHVSVDPDKMICRLDPKVTAQTIHQFAEDVSD